MPMRPLLASFLALAAFLPAKGYAQSAHGMHNTMVLPVVVDSATYQSRIYITSPLLPGGSNTTIESSYVPGDGTAQSQPLTCNTVTATPGQTLVFANLRELCPDLAQGSNFGYLRVIRKGAVPSSSSVYRGIHVYSRVSNAAGIGFSIEGFPEAAFTGTHQVVIGVDRLPAPYYSPAYQTNCFVGTFSDFPADGQIYVHLRRNGDSIRKSLGVLQPGPSRFIRLMDALFDPSMPPQEAITDATVEFSFWRQGGGGTGEGPYPFMAFCTVQDNTSLGADFRIAKPFGYPKDDHTQRRSQQTYDIYGRAFSLAPNSYATYYLDFRTPDIVGCDLIDASTNALLPANAGIELHLREANDTQAGQAVTGGDGTGQTRLYNVALGPKGTHGSWGNPGYLLVVQSTATPAASTINYGVVCRSGSGHSLLRRIESGSGRLIP